MANQVNFSIAQLGELKAFLDTYKSDTTNNAPLISAYNLVNSWIQTNPGVNSQTKLFFRFAVEVNNNSPTAANTYIREVTEKGLLFDNEDASPQTMQRTSNAIARSVFDQIGRDGGMPQLATIIQLDVTGAMANPGSDQRNALFL